MKAILTHYSNIPFSIVELLELIKSIFERLREEPSAPIKVCLLNLLGRLLRVKKPVVWQDLVVPGEEVEEFAGWFVGLNDTAKKTRKIQVNDLLFIVLAFMGANDFDSSVRFAAINLLGRLEDVKGNLIAQACKKDLLVDHSFALRQSVLACGVFAHGIEDQFMKLRLASLNSLYLLSSAGLFEEDGRCCSFVLNVFVDAWLDECDWIRLASLKLTGALIGKWSGHQLQLDGPLEALLAALDDFSEEIRTEALKLLGQVRTSGADAFLRTQRCLEALILKYEDEVHSEALECTLRFAHLNAEEIRKENAFLSHLLGSADSRYFVAQVEPSSLSTVQQAFLIPILSKECQNEHAKQLAFNLASKYEVPGLDSYIYSKRVNFENLSPSIPLVRFYDARLSSANVRQRTDLNPAEETKYYFPGTSYCRFKRLRLDPKPEEEIAVGELKCIQVEIGEFHLISADFHVQIGVKCGEFVHKLTRIPEGGFYRVKVPVPEGALSVTIRIVNLTNNLDMVPPVIYSFSNKS